MKRSGETLDDIVKVWASKMHRRALVLLYRDIDTLFAYLSPIYGPRAVELYSDYRVYGPHEAEEIADRYDVIHFPIVYGVDPLAPEASEWAKLTAHRVVEMPDGVFEEVSRFTSPSEAMRAIQSGVPAHYFQALEPQDISVRIPVDKVVAAYQSGLAPEYAQLFVYG